jgi:hypothetical protein
LTERRKRPGFAGTQQDVSFLVRSNEFHVPDAKRGRQLVESDDGRVASTLLESSRVKPSTRTLERLAEATGMKLRISFKPAPAR